MRVRFCDEIEVGFGWIVDDFGKRCSHALVDGGRVWLVDPVAGDGIEERVRAAGEPAGVLQLLDRHGRDAERWAERLAVPLHVVPSAPVDGASFTFVSIVRRRFWNEVALWWPETRVLVCGDALGTPPAFRAGSERLAVHPLLRFAPPRRALGGLEPRHVLCGHGEGVHGDEASPALREALATARRRLPGAWRSGFASAAAARKRK